jgi:hypothetical protein
MDDDFQPERANVAEPKDTPRQETLAEALRRGTRDRVPVDRLVDNLAKTAVKGSRQPPPGKPKAPEQAKEDDEGDEEDDEGDEEVAEVKEGGDEEEEDEKAEEADKIKSGTPLQHHYATVEVEYGGWVRALTGIKKLVLPTGTSIAAGFSNPVLVFTTLQATSHQLASTARVQKASVYVRIAESLYKQYGAEDGKERCVFAFSTATAWDMVAVSQSLLQKNWYLGDPYRASNVADKTSYIVVATRTADEMAAIHSKHKNQSMTDSAVKAFAHWFQLFGASACHLTPGEVRPEGFSLKALLATRFIQSMTLPGTVMWMLGMDKHLATLCAVSAVALGRKPLLFMDESELTSKASDMLLLAEGMKASTMMSTFDEPVRVFTATQLAREVFDRDDITITKLLKSETVPVNAEKVQEEGGPLAWIARDYPDYLVMDSAHRTSTGAPIGLGVFAKKSFKKGEKAFAVTQPPLLP